MWFSSVASGMPFRNGTQSDCCLLLDGTACAAQGSAQPSSPAAQSSQVEVEPGRVESGGFLHQPRPTLNSATRALA